MKKVRFALAAAGIPPALGLMVPTAAAATHAPVKTAKTVSLKHSKMTPDTGCNGNVASSVSNGKFSVTAWHTRENGCIGSVHARLFNSNRTGRVLRTRVYKISRNGAKTRVFSNYVGGHIGGNTISYSQPIHKEYSGYKQQVCGAIVKGSSHAIVLVSPLCVTFLQ